MAVKARDAVAGSLEPTSEAGHALASEWLETSARLMGRKPDSDFQKWLLAKYELHDARATRYWELVAIRRGQSSCSSPNREWEWLAAAMKHHLADAAAQP